MTRLLPVLCLWVGCVLCACRHTTRKSLAEMGMMERRSVGLKAMQEGGKDGASKYPSYFQRSASRTLNAANQDSVRWLEGKRSKVGSFSGSKLWSGNKAFTTKSFAQADQAGSLPIGPAPDASRQARLGVGNLKLPESPLAGQASNLGEETSRFAQKQFSAKSDVAGSKALGRSKVPEVIELPEQADKPAFTEEEVRRLLGRGGRPQP
jgi:hypothetical protein